MRCTLLPREHDRVVGRRVAEDAGGVELRVLPKVGDGYRPRGHCLERGELSIPCGLVGRNPTADGWWCAGVIVRL